MGHQIIWPKIQGKLRGDLPSVTQGSTLETLTIGAFYSDGTGVSLTGKTITATATDEAGNTTSITGTLTGGASQFTWALSEGDIGTDGIYTLIVTYTDGVKSWASDPARFTVLPNPAADAVQNPALVGIGADDAAWVAAGSAGGALGELAYIDDADSDGKQYARQDGAWEEIEAADVSALLPKTAGSGQAVTGILYLDPGADDTAQIFRIPATSTDAEDFVMNIGGANFSGVWDSIFNWGFNQTTGGAAEVAASHAWYLQLEYRYKPGNSYTEYHLNFLGASGAFNFRPFEYKYNIDGTTGTLVHQLSGFTFTSIGATDPVFVAADVGLATKNVSIYGIISLRPNTANSAAMVIVGGSSITVFTLNTSVNDVNWKTRVFDVATTAGVSILQVNALNRSVNVTGQAIFTASSAAAICFIAKGFTGQTAALLQGRDANDAIQFAIGPAGDIRTNQTAANTATPSGATALQLPIYNTTGTLLGYIPVYAAAWT